MYSCVDSYNKLVIENVDRKCIGDIKTRKLQKKKKKKNFKKKKKKKKRMMLIKNDAAVRTE